MLDTAQKRAALMRHLESAMALAHELNEPATEYLIERAIDEARAQQIPSLMIGDIPQRSAGTTKPNAEVNRDSSTGIRGDRGVRIDGG